MTDLLTAIALLAGRQPHNALLLHSARTVHEVVAEEYRIVETFELGTYTPGEWVKLFEVRLSLWTQQYRQRFPQATSSLLARVPSDVLASRACALSVTTSDTTHSPWIPDRVASGAPLRSSPVCLGSVSSRPGFTGDKSCVGSVRFFRRMSSRTHHAFVSDFPFSVCVKPGASPSHFSPQLGPVNWRGLSQSQVDLKNIFSVSLEVHVLQVAR